MRLDFAPSARSSLGVEWELALVDADSGDLRQVAPVVLDAVAPADGAAHPRIHQELLLNTVEIVTGVCRTVPEAMADLGRSVQQVRTITWSFGGGGSDSVWLGCSYQGTQASLTRKVDGTVTQCVVTYDEAPGQPVAVKTISCQASSR